MATRVMKLAEAARKADDRTTLFWNERGSIDCAVHAPYPGTDTWVWERWTLMTDEHRQAWTAEVGPPKCETCR